MCRFRSVPLAAPGARPLCARLNRGAASVTWQRAEQGAAGGDRPADKPPSPPLPLIFGSTADPLGAEAGGDRAGSQLGQWRLPSAFDPLSGGSPVSAPHLDEPGCPGFSKGQTRWPAAAPRSRGGRCLQLGVRLREDDPGRRLRPARRRGLSGHTRPPRPGFWGVPGRGPSVPGSEKDGQKGSAGAGSSGQKVNASTRKSVTALT